jgi:hypothetical protein
MISTANNVGKRVRFCKSGAQGVIVGFGKNADEPIVEWDSSGLISPCSWRDLEVFSEMPKRLIPSWLKQAKDD